MVILEQKAIIGKCPVCGKGHVMKYRGNYICTEHFTNADGHKRCSFSLPFNYRGAKIDDKIVKQLVETGETGYMNMKTVNGNPYRAKIVAIPGKGLNVVRQKKALDVRCPKCGGAIFVTQQGFACENELTVEPTCNFFIPNKIANRIIRENEVRDFITGKKEILDGFHSSIGVSFSGFLHMGETGMTDIVSKVGTCPDCGGDILVGRGGFNCSNYKNGCQFSIFREYYGHPLTASEVTTLLTDGKVEFPCTDVYGNIIYCRLTLVREGDRTMVRKEKFLSEENTDSNTTNSKDNGKEE